MFLAQHKPNVRNLGFVYILRLFVCLIKLWTVIPSQLINDYKPEHDYSGMVTIDGSYIFSAKVENQEKYRLYT